MAKEKIPRFPDYKWYCVACHECLSDQIGFDDNKFTWKCTHCNYKNSISKDNLRKPYAFLIDQSPKNRFINFLVGILRSTYGFLFRTAFCFLLTALIAVSTHRTSVDHLSLGVISPRGMEDYFCAALYTSGIIVFVLLVLYAISKKLIGRPDTKKHFLRETFYFFRDNLLYPVKIIKSLFQKTTVMDTVFSIIALVMLVCTVAFLVYGYLKLL
jgi:hypothetical protein